MSDEAVDRIRDRIARQQQGQLQQQTAGLEICSAPEAHANSASGQGSHQDSSTGEHSAQRSTGHTRSIACTGGNPLSESIAKNTTALEKPFDSVVDRVRQRVAQRQQEQLQQQTDDLKKGSAPKADASGASAEAVNAQAFPPTYRPQGNEAPAPLEEPLQELVAAASETKASIPEPQPAQPQPVPPQPTMSMSDYETNNVGCFDRLGDAVVRPQAVPATAEPDHAVLDPHTFDSSPTLQQLNRAGNSSFHIGSVAMRGRRPEMEDTHRVTLRLSDTHADTAFFGVFDGHGGDQVSQEVARDLHKAVGALPDLSDASLQRASLEFDARFNECWYCGSCSVYALVQPAVDGAHEVVVVNLGDSRAMLVHANGAVTDLTTDHKPDDPAEAARIMNAGGHVRYGRVDSNLAVSRAFGDSNYKSAHSLGPLDQKVIALPDIVRVRAAVTDKLLLICDGVVERMNNTQVAEIVHDYRSSDPALVVSELVYRSFCEGSGDNHSAMLVIFKDGTQCGLTNELRTIRN